MEKTRIVNYPKKRNFKKTMVATALGLSLALGTTSVPAFNNMATVEAAKRDKKKPKIKLFGQKKLEVTEGEKVTIPKTTYSDNQTKKKKLKVAVTVKKENKNYKSIANKIKSATVKNKPVTVTFDEEGTYKITTTVTDLSKNKATAVRTVTVNNKQEVIEAEKIVIKQDPIVTTEQTRKTVTTEQPVTEEPKKEEKSTEQQTKEEPKKEQDDKTEEKTTEESKKEEKTTEQQTSETSKEEEQVEEPTKPNVFDKISYVKQVKVGDNTLNMTNSVAYMYDFKYNPELNYKIGFENNCSGLAFKYDENLKTNANVLKYLGKPIAYDENGNDISDRILIYETFSKSKYITNGFEMKLIVTDGNKGYISKTISVGIFDVNEDFTENVLENFVKINENPVIYIYPEEPVLSNSKKLVLE